MTPIPGYVWRLRRLHPDRHGQPCTITPLPVNNWEILVTFADGFSVRTTRQAVANVGSKVYRVEVR